MKPFLDLYIVIVETFVCCIHDEVGVFIVFSYSIFEVLSSFTSKQKKKKKHVFCLCKLNSTTFHWKDGAYSRLIQRYRKSPKIYIRKYLKLSYLSIAMHYLPMYPQNKVAYCCNTIIVIVVLTYLAIFYESKLNFTPRPIKKWINTNRNSIFFLVHGIVVQVESMIVKLRSKRFSFNFLWIKDWRD